ncbi:MAG: hypothetical protein OEZ23_01760, partial [Gammaproteobacteria bacterium]|nr:hypothetical protein [Gammaproteobacteria bacterium]
AATSESKSGSNPEPHTRESSEQTGDWKALLERLPLEGITQTLAMNCTLHQTSDSHWVLTLNREHESLWNSQHDARIGSAVSRHLGREVKVSIEVGDTTEETPAEILARQKAERQAAAEQAIEKDKQVQHLIQAFGGRLNPGSIRPLETNNTGEKDGH